MVQNPEKGKLLPYQADGKIKTQIPLLFSNKLFSILNSESAEVEAVNASNGAPPGFYGAIDLHNANVPQLDEEGFCIRPEVNENDILTPDPSLPFSPSLTHTHTHFHLGHRNIFISFIASTQCKL
ncbi:hypothetical protein cypCar_00038271 [Cyprinus carpio]|nr:hypothetical protein cypCar_00038271 [Cyprinus carpio]